MSLSTSLFKYGQHFPQGLQAVQFITSEQGMWKQLQPAEYIWNYYDYPLPMPDNHPYNTSALIGYANGTKFTSCRDANAHLLLDLNHDGELDTTKGNYAYFEHSGRGTGNIKLGNPFTNFWFDDNSLAKYMNQAYDLPEPSGLSYYNDFTRWRIVGGDAAYWSPYADPASYTDQLALNGLYYLAINQTESAMVSWQRILALSQASFNTTRQEFDYPMIVEAYHFSLWLTLTSFLYTTLPQSKKSLYLQHYVSLRSLLLRYQVIDADTDTVGYTVQAGPFYGWTSNLYGTGNSLMNTESVAMGVLALGSGYDMVYEVYRQPMLIQADLLADNVRYEADTNHLSAMVGQGGKGGYLAYGPYTSLTAGEYQVEYLIRGDYTTAVAASTVATIDVHDATNDVILVSSNVTIDSFQVVDKDTWLVVDVALTVSKEIEAHALEYRLYWWQTMNLDVACIRIVKTN